MADNVPRVVEAQQVILRDLSGKIRGGLAMLPDGRPGLAY